MRDLPQLKQYGHFVSKNTKVAIKLQSCNVGESFEHKQLDYIKRMRTHRIVLENRADFQNQKIEIAGDSLLYQYRDIHDFLSALQKNQGEMYAIERRIVDLKQSNELGMEISAASGIAVRHANEDVRDAQKRADEAMYACKQLYYEQNGNDRRGN